MQIKHNNAAKTAVELTEAYNTLITKAELFIVVALLTVRRIHSSKQCKI